MQAGFSNEGTNHKPNRACISPLAFLLLLSSVVRLTLLYINAGPTEVPVKVHKWPSLRLVRNPSERFQTSWNDNHKESDLRRTTLGGNILRYEGPAECMIA
jgi:hypothetical protein